MFDDSLIFVRPELKLPRLAADLGVVDAVGCLEMAELEVTEVVIAQSVHARWLKLSACRVNKTRHLMRNSPCS